MQIDRITTDRQVSISSFMYKDGPQINHQYDVWHLSKWVVKKLTSKAEQKGCEELMPWIVSMSNRLWWCVATCAGNVVLLREKWKSVLHHIVNKHKWTHYFINVATGGSRHQKRRTYVGLSQDHLLT